MFLTRGQEALDLWRDDASRAAASKATGKYLLLVREPKHGDGVI